MRAARRNRQRLAQAALRTRGARALLHPAARRQAPAPPGRKASPAALDGGIVASVALLAGLGIVMIYSTTAPLSMGHTVPPHFVRHLAGLALALLAATCALRTPLALWRRLALPLWGVSVLLLAATLAAGLDANGARRWLRLPFVGATFQAAELAKFATPLAVASLLAGARPERWQPLCVAALLTALPVGLLLLQPNLGSAVVTATLVGGVLFVAGVPLARLLGCAGVAAAGAGVYIAFKPYALARWVGFLAPWQNARSEGFQLVQSFVAFGRGGTLGVGLGARSSPTCPRPTPTSSSRWWPRSSGSWACCASSAHSPRWWSRDCAWPRARASRSRCSRPSP
jgi:cell division protein FtsW